MGERVLLVDARAPYGSGLGRYFREMVRAFVAQREFPEVVLAGDPDELEAFVRTLDAPVRVLRMRGGRYSVRVPMQWDAVARAVGVPHLTWFPHWDGAWRAAPRVMTLHDLIALDGAGPRGFARRAIARSWMTRMVDGSAAVLTASQASAARISTAFPSVIPKLHVVPHGVAAVFFAAGAAADAPARGSRADGSPYLLTVANKKPHKRLETAIRAFARIAATDPTLRLVMVGERFAHSADLQTLAESLGVASRVDDESGLSDEALAARYAGATALLVPSRDEGFGMVVLEAMACGTPVVAVDRSPLPEVVGTAGVLVPYDDDAAMADAVRRIRGDVEVRTARIAAGQAHAAPFTWGRAASRTAEILRAC